MKDGARWRSVNFEQHRKQTGKSSPSSGVLEVLAQNIDLHWTNADRTVKDIEYLVRPLTLQTTSASVIFRACEQASDTLSMAGLRRIGSSAKLFILAEVPDNVSANNRKKAAAAAMLPVNCLYAGMLGCTVHRLHRIIEASTNESELIGGVHAVSLVSSVPRYRNTMLQRLREIVDEELEILDSDQPAWARHRVAILKHSLGREFHFVRGSRMPGDNMDEDNRERTKLGVKKIEAVLKQVAVLEAGRRQLTRSWPRLERAASSLAARAPRSPRIVGAAALNIWAGSVEATCFTTCCTGLWPRPSLAGTLTTRGKALTTTIDI